MTMWMFFSGGLLLATVMILQLWRWSDRHADRALGSRLGKLQPVRPGRFDSQSVTDLPDAARRYFQFSIQPGAPLYTVARISMEGKFALGDREKPGYLDMTAEQTLAAPHGFIWGMRAAKGWMHLSGSDSQSWTRFWLAGVLPVARQGGQADHRRSAFGRYVAEAAIWTPAALLPGDGVTWEGIDMHTARVTVTYRDLSQQVDIHVDDEGRPAYVSFQRWSNANPEKQFRLQPFGAYPSEFREFQSFTLPTHVEAGNHFGTESYFPFFIVDVTRLEFPLGNADDQSA